MQLLVPRKLNLTKLKKQIQLRGFGFDRIIIFLAYLSFSNRSKDRREHSEENENHWHEIHSKTLKKVLGNEYALALQKMESIGLIEIDSGYFSAKDYHHSRSRSRRYRIHKNIFDAEIEYRYHQIKEPKGKNCLNAFMKYIARQRSATIDLPVPVKELLISSLDQIDIESLPRVHHFHHKSGPSMDKFGKRFHSSLTNLKSTHRKDLTLLRDSENLVEIDIRNCQAFLLSQLQSTGISVQGGFSENQLLTKPISDLFETEGMKKFRGELRIGDDVYQNLGKHLGMKRDKAKKLFFKVIFGYANGRDLFKGYYPGLENGLNEIKNQRISRNPSKKWHSNLAFLLQRMESQFVLSNVITDIIEKEGIDFVATIHDSFIVKESEVAKMEEALIRVSNNLFDIPIKYRVEPLKKAQKIIPEPQLILDT